MKNISKFLYALLKIWNLYQRKQSLYKQLLALDGIGSLRRTCSQGYMISTLFKSDISTLYDLVKCTLSDGTINECKKKLGIPTIVFASEKESSLTAILLEQEGKTIRLYKLILENNDDLSVETRRIFTEHVEKLSELRMTLQHQIIKRLPAQNHGLLAH